MTRTEQGSARAAGIHVGATAPGIDTIDASGDPFRLHDVLASGRVVLLGFIRGTW